MFFSVLCSQVREVSNRILSTTDNGVESDNELSYLATIFGQWNDHDLTFTPHSPSIRSFSSGLNCDTSCEQSNPCFPIPVCDIHFLLLSLTPLLSSVCLCPSFSVSPSLTHLHVFSPPFPRSLVMIPDCPKTAAFHCFVRLQPVAPEILPLCSADRPMCVSKSMH